MPANKTLIQLARIALLWFVSQAALSMARGQTTCPVDIREQDPVSRAASAYLAQSSNDSRHDILENFYKPCGYALLWSSNGVLTTQAQSLLIVLASVGQKGLDPQDYGTEQLQSHGRGGVAFSGSADELAQFDVALTTAAVRLVSDLSYGRAAPEDPTAGYNVHPDKARVTNVVWSELARGNDLPAALQSLEPQAPGYERAERALQTYLERADRGPDLPLPPQRPMLHPGSSSPAVLLLRSRLQQLTDLPTPSLQRNTLYQGEIVAAVEQFQELHGMARTGVVDSVTWERLAVPIRYRVTQLALTLERWRWVPHSFSEPPAVVNIPEYRLRLYDEQMHVVLSMRVIVGSAANRQTPVLQSEMTQVIFHPYWNVPHSIQEREILPHVLNNPEYLSKHGYQLVNSRGAVVGNGGAASALRSGGVRVRQLPGSENALGIIKFSFPNPFDVYMHGTPKQSLFKEYRRDFSHGCIRVEDPAALALWSLRRKPDWTKERIAAAIADPKTFAVTLARPIPVLIVYGTGIAAEDASIRFFDDVYGYDAQLIRQLKDVSQKRQLADAKPW